jgi:hypothetical protein
VQVVAGSFAAVKAQRSLVARDDGNGHDLDTPVGQAFADGVQQCLADVLAAGIAADYQRFQDAELVSSLP